MTLKDETEASLWLAAVDVVSEFADCETTFSQSRSLDHLAASAAEYRAATFDEEIVTTDDDIAEALAYADGGPALSRAAAGRLARRPARSPDIIK